MGRVALGERTRARDGGTGRRGVRAVPRSARTTILTVMEKLREKGYLVREKRGAVYEYRPAVPKAQLLHEQVEQFVEGTLGGSFAPFLAYLAQETQVSDEQLDELKQLVRDLEQGQGRSNSKGDNDA